MNWKKFFKTAQVVLKVITAVSIGLTGTCKALDDIFPDTDDDDQDEEKA